MRNDDIDALLGRELRARAPGIVAAYLFGSSARGDSRPDSDIDVALLYEKPLPATLEAQPFALAADLSSVLGRSVDVVVMNAAPLDLVHRVFRDGRLIVERDRSARIAFEVRARSAYFDLMPTLRRYRRREQAP